MVIIVISVRYKRIMQVLSQYNYRLIKRDGPKVFYFIDDHYDDIIRYTKKLIVKELGPMLVFEVYGLYNGVIDYTAYLPESKKKESSYYNRKQKDLSDEELEKFKREMK